MRTFYNSEFTKKLSRKELPFMPKEYKSFFKTSLKTNTKSITQSDFVSQKIIKTESCRPDKSFVSVKFSGRSSYERDFIEWKPETVDIVPHSLPYRGYMIKSWELKSNYKNNFKNFDNYSNNLVKTTSSTGIKSLVNPSNQNTFETTNNFAYKPLENYKPSNSDLAIMRNKRENEVLVNPTNHYRTFYSSEFKNHPIKPNLTRLRN